MVSRDRLKEELENSSVVRGEIEEVRFAKILTCLEALYDSEEPRGITGVRDELEYDHDVARDACVWGEELGYVERGAYGSELTETGRTELAGIFE